jgi:tetratricopeptide (TPR) repeat protein
MKEGETYRSMGLLEESLGVFQGLLTGNTPLDPADKQKIEANIEELQKEIASQVEKEAGGFSSEEMANIKENLSGHEKIPSILDSAFAFKELGLYSDAVSEYAKLVGLDYPLKKIVPELGECLLRFGSQAEIIQRVEKIVLEQELDDKKTMQLKYGLGAESKRRGQKGLAIELYRAAKKLDCSNKDMKVKPLSAETNNQTTKPGREESSAHDAVTENTNNRAEDRITPKVPEFVYVEFSLGETSEDRNTYRLNVLNYSKHGLGLLITEKDAALLGLLNPGDVIKEMTFFARWTMITVDVTVRHKTKIGKGVNKDQHILGVESKELINDCVLPK